MRREDSTLLATTRFEIEDGRQKLDYSIDTFQMVGTGLNVRVTEANQYGSSPTVLGAAMGLQCRWMVWRLFLLLRYLPPVILDGKRAKLLNDFWQQRNGRS